jgi:hypothetical protein
MPTRRANGVYYVKRHLPGAGKVYRSLGTKSKVRARQREDAILRLCERGHSWRLSRLASSVPYA